MFKNAFTFYFVSLVAFAVQFALFMSGSVTAECMDLQGYAFFIAACISHAACIALAPLLIALILATLKLRRTAAIVHVVLVALFSLAIHTDKSVYALYRFHVNGIVIGMFFGKGGNEVFNFSTWLYAEAALLALLVIACYGFLRFAVGHWRLGFSWRLTWILVGFIVADSLFVHAYHAYAAFYNKTSVRMSARLLPYFFPTTANGMLLDMGLRQPQSIDITRTHASSVVYPLHPIAGDSERQTKPHIVLILIDAWNKAAFTPECMPNLWAYAQEGQVFDRHWSCSNGTRSGVFGIFFSIPPYYWESFESNRVSPVLIDELLRQGYTFRNFPSAQQYDPPFGRVLFHRVANVRVNTPGNTSLARDRQITDDFVAFFADSTDQHPSFSFLFYDLPHSFELPKDSLYHFQPSWEYAKYTSLDNNADPTPFWNLYRNTCYQVDMMLASVFRAIERSGQQDRTVVIITGDHAQEFNENHKNYWGHNGNFSDAQIAVPLVCHLPGLPPAHFGHRTTHYDIAPTLMREYLHVSNPISDYSVGHTLTDTASRCWHIVGSELNYAFINDHGDIIEKKADGSVDITDARLNPIDNYHLDAREMNDALRTLNRFFR